MSADVEKAAAISVHRRHVFFVSGFDPRGPALYHKLYREECGKQASVNGLTIEVGKRQTVDEIESRWALNAGGTETTYSFLRYEDIIRQHWPNTGAVMAAAVLRYLWHFTRMGVLRAILRNSWPCFVAVTYPLGLLATGYLLAAIVYAVLAFLLALVVGPWGWLIALPVFAAPLYAYAPIEKRYNAFWLARSCHFLVLRALGRVAGIEERCAAFAARVAAAANGNANGEVLLIGHSVGAHISVTVAARALAQMQAHAKLRYLTIGHAIAMTPAEPQAQQFRKDLLALATSPQIIWHDVTSAVDGSCIALSDPLAVSGVARPEGATVQPKLISSRFNKLFSAEGYKAIRRNFLRAHFQYLMAAEIAGDYDFFLITAGDQTLETRFAHLDSVSGFDRFRIGKP